MKWGKSPIRSPAEILIYFFINIYADIYQSSYNFYITVTNCCMKRRQRILGDRQQYYFYWSVLPGHVLPKHRRGPYGKNGKEGKDALHGCIGF